ncbi:MAG: type IV secretion system DNA-binding domain-containing protein [Candidatus Niyogibacteria bacterium]|nr:type IV secretion system DNA-binding domain-containing protein [Candidatus Niyogibacteria bacterium]
MDPEQIIYFAETDFRNKRQQFGIKRRDRTKHTYVVGKSGMGKTTLLENMAIQDIISGNGVGIIDPHGDFAEKMLNYVPKERIKDVIYFNPVDTSYPIGFNIMEGVGEDQRHLVAAGLMGVFKKIWPDVWSARMEYILNNTVLALLEYPGSTLLGINRMLADKDYRKKVVDNVTDEVVKAFWTQEFAKYTERFAQEATPAIQNKIGQFITNSLIRNIVGQEKSSFDMRKIMDEKKILIMNLSKGKVGESNSHLLGAMLITKLYLAAMSRVDTPEEERNDFYLYVDEFQNFATDAFSNILSEARKYRLNLIIAHQYIGQLVTETSTRVRDAVFGNVGTMIAFRVGGTDAEFLEKEFAPEFTALDLVNLPFAGIYLKLMVDGVTSFPFSAKTLPPLAKAEISFKEDIIKNSQQTYGARIEGVKEKIAAWHAPAEGVERAGGDAQIAAKTVSPKYEASCSVCHKAIMVPFKPDGKRPVYCPEHMGMSVSATPRPVATNQGDLRPGTVTPNMFKPRPERQREKLAEVPRFPAPKDGELVVKKPEKTISLSDLTPKKSTESKKLPNLEELRRALQESLAATESVKKPSEVKKAPVPSPVSGTPKNILKPGQIIKFD